MTPTVYPLQYLSLLHKGAVISTGHTDPTTIYIAVNGQTVAAASSSTLPLAEGRRILDVETELPGGPAHLAVFIKRRMLITEWVVMDGDDVVGALYPNQLPPSRRPKR